MRHVAQNIEAQLRSPLFPYHNRVRLVNYGEQGFYLGFIGEGLLLPVMQPLVPVPQPSAAGQLR